MNIHTNIHLARKLAFTLAEVVIVVGIIGIVAEMTIPVVLQQVNDKNIEVGAKAVYSLLTRATSQLLVNQELDLTTTDTMTDSYAKVLKVVKKDDFGNIFINPYANYKSNSRDYAYSGTSPAVVLANGMFIRFFSNDVNCAYSNTYSGSLGGKVCGTIIVDTNGNKMPNMRGKDALNFWITREDSIYKIRAYGDSDLTSCTSPASSQNESMGCTAYYLLNKTLP